MDSPNASSIINILYVDDEPVLLNATKIFLEHMGGVSVSTADSAPDALKMLENKKYDAIISDYQMPEMDGLDFLRSVRCEGCDIPFIIFTGRGREEVVIEALNAGADFYLQKGGNPTAQYTELLHKVQQAVRRRTAEKELRESESKYRLIVETALEGVWQMDENMKTVFVNRSMAEMLGYTVNEMVGRDIREFMPKEELTVHDALIEGRRKGERARYARTFIRKDGTNITGHVSATPVMSERGEFKGSFAMVTDITELKRSHQWVIESEERYHGLFTHMPTGVAIYQAVGDGEDFIFTDFNPAAEEIDQIKREDLIGKSINSAFPCVREFGLYDVLRRVWKTGKPEQFPVAQYKDERIEGWRDNYIFRLSSGEVVAIYNDITKQKKTEEKLELSEEKYRGIFENAVLGIFQTAPDGALINANDAFAQMYGYSNAKEMLDTGINVGHEIYENPEDREKVIEILKKDGILIPTEFEVKKRDKSKFWILSTARPVKTIDDNVQYYEGICADITKQKNIEDTLRESEDKFRSVFENQLNGLMIIDPESHAIIDINKAALSMFGSEYNEVVGKVCHTYICPAEVNKCPVTDLGKTVDNSERVMLSSKGELVPICKSVNQVSIEGKPFLVESFIDISLQKNAERAVQEANKKLNLLTSIVRHDILNYLTGCESYIQLMQMKTKDETLNDYLKNMEISAKAVENLIRFTKEYQDLGVEQPKWQDVSKIVDEVKFEPIFSEITIINSLNSQEILADDLLNRVFYNIFENSIRHGVKVGRIEISSTESDNECVIILEDDGIGIDTKDKENIFKEHFGKNTGLGLFLAKEILSITGISISETGTQGKGARFEISVPKGYWRKN